MSRSAKPCFYNCGSLICVLFFSSRLQIIFGINNEMWAPKPRSGKHLSISPSLFLVILILALVFSQGICNERHRQQGVEHHKHHHQHHHRYVCFPFENIQLDTVFPRIVSMKTILFLTLKTLKISYSFCIRYPLM